VTRTQPRDRVGRLGHWFHAHDAFPVHGIAVQDLERDRRTSRATLADTAGDAYLVALDLLPCAPPVTELPPPEIGVDLSGRQREACRDAVEKRDHAGSM
jgi:hypothetical protein